ncbi:MAG: 30S ribosomal protein S3 [Dehalococcoidia bacterium]|nr:MAG: 30S ribosomal protein S3 [Dehalococcoidia bacterium]
MGRKVHPMGFRLGIIRDWQSKWYDDKHYAEFILEDVKLRRAVQSKYNDAGISLVEIERQGGKVGVTIHTSRPGIVIGRGGQRVEEMRQYLEGVLGGKKIQLDIREIRQPELDAYLVARSVAEQMERRVAYRRAMKQSIFRTLQAGAKGMRILCSGRLGGVEIARRQLMHQGRVPLQTLRADVDYGFTEAHTTLGRIGVKVWIYRGDIFPAVEAAEEVTVVEAPVVSTTAPAVAPVAAPTKDLTMAEAVARMAEAPVKDVTEAPAAAVKKPRTRKKAVEAPAVEVKTVEETAAKSEVAKEAEKKAKPRAKKVEAAPIKAEKKAEEKPPKAKIAKAKTESVKESKSKAKKEE